MKKIVIRIFENNVFPHSSVTVLAMLLFSHSARAALCGRLNIELMSVFLRFRAFKENVSLTKPSERQQWR